MIVELLTEHHLELLSLKGGCRGSSKSTLVKMSNCWKYHATAHIIKIQRTRKNTVIPVTLGGKNTVSDNQIFSIKITQSGNFYCKYNII